MKESIDTPMRFDFKYLETNVILLLQYVHIYVKFCSNNEFKVTFLTIDKS